jgi:type I restriction enzyme S subunit
MKPLEHEITHQETLLAKLKQAILQEAISGKLTADWRAAYPDVEPASQLLHRIQAEKNRLIEAKKLRPEKPLPKITPTEIPFEIPKGWEWCRLGAIASHSLGKMLDHGKNKGTPKPYLRNLNVQWFRLVLSDLKEMRFEEHEIEKYAVEKGDIVICEGGYPGQAAIWEQDEPIMFQKALHRVRFIAQGYEPVLFVQYLKLADTAGFLKEYYTGSGIKHFTGDALHSFVLPLPPLAEQAAIVARVEVLIEHCRALAAEIAHTRTHATHLLQAVLKEAFAPTSTNR